MTAASSPPAQARRLLLATGITDELPPLAGLTRLRGSGVFHCLSWRGSEASGEDIAMPGGDKGDNSDQAPHLVPNLAGLGCDVVPCWATTSPAGG